MTIVPFRSAKKELEDACIALKALKASKTSEDIDREWRRVLGNIEKAWQKIRLGGKNESSFGGWIGQYEKARKIDPLLQYVNQARDADNHSIQDLGVFEEAYFGIGIDSKGAKSITIDRLVISNGQITEYIGEYPLIRKDIPARFILQDIINRGKSYEVPKTHLSNSLFDQSPQNIAELAIKYYEQIIAAAEKKFF